MFRFYYSFRKGQNQGGEMKNSTRKCMIYIFLSLLKLYQCDKLIGKADWHSLFAGYISWSHSFTGKK